MRALAPLLVLFAALGAACSTHDPTSPAPAVAEVFAAIKTRSAARLGALLDATPSLASVRRPDGTSAVLVALFLLDSDGETFVRRQDNPLLRLLAEHHPVPQDLFDAAALGDTRRLDELLITTRADVDALHPKGGFAPLHVAAFAGQTGAIHDLLARGATVDRVTNNEFHNTPLLLAVIGRQVEAAALLLDHGASLEATQEAGTRVTHLAAENDDVAMLELLAAHRASLDARADDGRTPLDVALEKRRTAAAAWLQAHGGGVRRD